MNASGVWIEVPRDGLNATIFRNKLSGLGGIKQLNNCITVYPPSERYKYATLSWHTGYRVFTTNIRLVISPLVKRLTMLQ